MAFIDNFPTYKGDRPESQGRYVNMEKKQIEDWTHTALKSSEPNPLAISFKRLGANPEAVFDQWVKDCTSDIGGGEFKS